MEDFEKEVSKFRSSRHYKNNKSASTYFESHQFKFRVWWANCYRTKEYNNINTNNVIEGWHDGIKFNLKWSANKLLVTQIDSFLYNY